MSQADLDAYEPPEAPPPPKAPSPAMPITRLAPGQDANDESSSASEVVETTLHEFPLVDDRGGSQYWMPTGARAYASTIKVKTEKPGTENVKKKEPGPEIEVKHEAGTGSADSVDAHRGGGELASAVSTNAEQAPDISRVGPDQIPLSRDVPLSEDRSASSESSLND